MKHDELQVKIDRTGWPTGPWDVEPDRIEWRTEAGYPAIMQRVRHGAWCGYVAVPPGHPDHGAHYDAIDVDVHGGLTYADECKAHVCHVPEPGEPDDVWWLGFDCVHCDDFAPGLMGKELSWKSPTDGHYGEYRDVPWVRAEVESLARQLAARASLGQSGDATPKKEP